jgi:hypothetical protein
MKKLKGVFVEIEVPDDFPDAADWDEIGEYLDAHPEVGHKIVREYEAAYYRWEAEGGLERWIEEGRERYRDHAQKDQRVAAAA